MQKIRKQQIGFFLCIVSTILFVSKNCVCKENILNGARNFIGYRPFFGRSDGNRLTKYEHIANDMEAVVRLTFNERLMGRFYCDMLRSAALYWNSNLLGKFLLIFDEKDNSTQIIKELNTLSTLSFRAVHEKAPKNTAGFLKAGKILKRPIGYIIQLYSSFLMDLYTDKKILAWIDTDSTFIMPVIAENVMNSKNQIVVKGLNTVKKFEWIKKWENSTENALGLPMVSDFMTYFPVFLYTSTIRNCRRYLMSRFKTTDFEEAFLKFTDKLVSPVIILMSYAYYFEHDLYEWHLDIADTSLADYNKNRLKYHPLVESDMTPEVHLTIHSGYHTRSPPPLESALCYTRISAQQSLPAHCEPYTKKENRMPFEFQDTQRNLENHYETWCKGEGNKKCQEIVKTHYNRYWEECKQGIRTFNPDFIREVEKHASARKFKCGGIQI